MSSAPARGLQRNYLIRHIPCQALVKVRKTADGSTVDQLAVDLAFLAALIATHEHDVLFTGDFCRSFAEGVPFHQHVIVVFEEKHSHDFRGMRMIFELGQDHLAELVGYGVAWLENIYVTFMATSLLCNFLLSCSPGGLIAGRVEAGSQAWAR